jgi:hypothetical protein
MFKDKQIEENCFYSFSQDVGQFFDVSQSEQAYIWPIGGVGDDGSDTPFLVNNGINGYILTKQVFLSTDTNIISSKSKSKLNFTGRVFKKWPSWFEYYVGGDRKRINFEVVYEDKAYLIFEYYMSKELKDTLEPRCTFEIKEKKPLFFNYNVLSYILMFIFAVFS